MKFSNESRASKVANEYQESNEVMHPYDLSKNPYKWKDHSGILDTQNVPVLMGSADVVVTYTGYSGAGLKFEKMIDEHTATFSVMVGEEGSMIADGEIAVILTDSDPPIPADFGGSVGRRANGRCEWPRLGNASHRCEV